MTNSSTTSVPSQPSVPNVANLIKLDEANYSLWLAQITPLICSQGLKAIVDGSSSCPCAFLLDDAGELTDEVNPDYEQWIQKNQLVLSWINGSLSPTILGTVTRFNSAHDVWDSLANRFASHSEDRILQLRGDLLRCCRGDSSITDFLGRINSIADNLSLSGAPVSDNDLVATIMNNVGNLYETTVASAQARDTPITYNALKALLLSAERRLASVAMAASTPRGRGRGSPGGFSSPNSGSRRGGGLVGSFPAQSGSFSQPRRRRPICQICGRAGHTALDCYYRMNPAYEGRVPIHKLFAMAAASTNPFASQGRLADTGANSDITPDLNNSGNPKEYQGADKCFQTRKHNATRFWSQKGIEA